MKVRNINGTSDNDCKCGSWIQHWENFSGATVMFCSEKNCTNTDLLGAHVQKMYSNDWYIIPLCQKHNKTADELEIVDSTIFVSANRSKTCEK